MKIFCRDCRWYRDSSAIFDDQCNHPANFADDYCAPAHVRRYKPEEQNGANDCELFKERPTKKWWRK